MEQSKILYARASNNKILEWKITATENGKITMSTGYFGGKKRLTFEYIKEGKNIGKSNETSIAEQTYLRFESRIEDKKKRGYVDVGIENPSKKFLDEAVPETKLDKDGFVKPMKASSYYKSKKDFKDETGKVWKNKKYYLLKNPDKASESDIAIKFPCLVQRKINGVRAFVYFDEDENVVIKSKEGLLYENLKHIEDFFNMNKDLIFRTDYVYDGELYIHGESLQTISSAVKAYNMNTTRVQFIVYDMAVEDLTNLERVKELKIFNNIGISNLSYDVPVSKIQTYKVKSNEKVQELTDNFIKEGYEGSIIRSLDAKYQFGKRNSSMVKLKRVISEDFKIMNVISQPKNKDKGMFVCISNGKKFKVNPTFSDELKIEILKNKYDYINKKVQCTFYEYTDDNIPFHIIDTTIRDYE